MQYVIIFILIIVIALTTVLILKKKIIEERISDNKDLAIEDVRAVDCINLEAMSEFEISVEELQKEMIPDDATLVEVKDEKMLARIDSLIPGFCQVGVAANNIVQATGETVYKAIIPAGT